jgi:chemotaxis signal transduction protein
MTTAMASPAEHAATARLGGTYLMFRLASEEYGLGILKVREILKILLDIDAVLPGDSEQGSALT